MWTRHIPHPTVVPDPPLKAMAASRCSLGFPFPEGAELCVQLLCCLEATRRSWGGSQGGQMKPGWRVFLVPPWMSIIRMESPGVSRRSGCQFPVFKTRCSTRHPAPPGVKGPGCNSHPQCLRYICNPSLKRSRCKPPHNAAFTDSNVTPTSVFTRM